MGTVYVFRVEDADADGWSAELAVAATSAGEAGRRLRAAGLRKKQIHHEGRPVRVVDAAEVPELSEAASGVVRRRSGDSGWTTWSAVPVGTSLSWRTSGGAVVDTRSSGHR
ncbi:hypothetical protein [Cellulomonas sp.]|uniref:hypothetical protein n=1 Tax=Cellulomonas sp. TaxID=40001 RepID=UPI001B276B8C|nr:hypothetical protein [Cellulomonas sp.]MBO9554748.1 hypothetical protein [Cellulomonas sp.]